MYIFGYHKKEWAEHIDKRPIHIAKALIDLFGVDQVLASVKTYVPDVRNKEKLIKMIELQLVERGVKSWNRGKVRL